MTIYEVNLFVDTAIADEYAEWLKGHVDEMLEIDGFQEATWYAVENDNDAEEHWCIHYRLDNREALEAYFNGPAERMRGDGLRHFRGRFTAERRVLQVVS